MLVLSRTHVLGLALAAAAASTGCSGAKAPAAASAGPTAKATTARGNAPPLPVTKGSPKAAPRETPAGLTALRGELDRAMKTLGSARPPAHHLAYTVTHHEDANILAEYGVIDSETHREGRTFDVDVRVGSREFDSHHASRNVGPVGAYVQALPLEAGDTLASRQVAWLATERAYKDAVERFVSLKNQRDVRTEEEDKSPDFSIEEPTRYIGEPAPALGLDVDGWKKRLASASARFKGKKEILESHVSLQARRRTRWHVSSEGSEVAFSDRSYRLTITASAQADDGMHLSRFRSFEAWTPEGLPTDAQLTGAIAEIISGLEALRRAPLAEPFTGPAILEGRAAGVFFHEVIGHRLEAHRLRSDSDGQTFGKKLGQPVMPSFLSLYDDPTILKIGETELNGHYFFDDEGVPARRASLVDRGVLKEFLLSRTPARGLLKSNGHGRRQEGRPLVARQGNLVLEASDTVPVASLRARLIDEAKKQGRPYGLRFVDIQGGFTDTSRHGTQGFKVMPTVVYRVYTDGRPDELIRGVDIVGTPLAMLMRIQAAGDDYGIFNGVCGAESGWVPVSATSPSLFLGQIETALKDKGNDKPPVLEAPALRDVPGSADEGGAR
ncbi:MAG: TldD/PmbA family protein [Labilithrix sp.]|nr:TldD/PmbA family protein [Labilithrix sp.]